MGLVVDTVDIAVLAAGGFWCVETCLDQVLAFCFGDQWLELGSGECVDQSGFGHDQEQDLGASEN